MSEHEKVKEFHRVIGIPTQDSPAMPDEPTRMLRCRLLLEETLEYVLASGFAVGLDQDGGFELIPYGIPDLAVMAQENADVRYIAHGNDLAMGVDGRVFDAVHAANLAKAPDGIVRRDERGKVVKPEGWKPPDVARLLAEWES